MSSRTRRASCCFSAAFPLASQNGNRKMRCGVTRASSSTDSWSKSERSSVPSRSTMRGTFGMEDMVLTAVAGTLTRPGTICRDRAAEKSGSHLLDATDSRCVPEQRIRRERHDRERVDRGIVGKLPATSWSVRGCFFRGYGSDERYRKHDGESREE